MQYFRRECRPVAFEHDTVIYNGSVWYIEQDQYPEYPRMREGMIRTNDLYLINRCGRYGDYSDSDVDLHAVLQELENTDPTVLNEISYDDLRDVTTHRKLFAIAAEHGFFVSPVYALVHSSITFSLYAFGDQWDSGQSGWIYAYPDAVKEAGGMDAMKQQAKDEIDELNMYLHGEIYNILRSPIVEIHDDRIYVDPSIDCELSDIYGLEAARERLKELTNG